MVYYSVQPTNRPTNTIYILIINELHVGWYINQLDQPDNHRNLGNLQHIGRDYSQPTVGNPQPTTTNQKHLTTNYNQPLQLYYYYYLTNLLLTTYIYL